MKLFDGAKYNDLKGTFTGVPTFIEATLLKAQIPFILKKNGRLIACHFEAQL